MRTLSVAAGVALAASVFLLVRPAPQGVAALTAYSIGDHVELPELAEVFGDPIDLSSVRDEAATGIVIEFWSARCPITDAFSPRVDDLEQRYRARGVRFVSVAACSDEEGAEVSSKASQLGVNRPVMIDPTGQLVRQFSVEKTPHFVVIDPTGTLVYSGAFDGGLQAVPDRPSYVERVLDDLVVGEPVHLSTTRTFGSPIRR